MMLRRELESLESRETPAVFIWSGLGADANWSTAGNWKGNSGPAQAAGGTALDLVFPTGAAQPANINSLAAGTVVNSITVQAAGYTFSGNAIVLGTGSTGDFFVLPGASADFGIATTLNTTGTPVMSVGTGATLTISGVLSSNAGAFLKKIGNGTLVLSGNNAALGARIDVNAGILRGTGSANAFGTTQNDTYVAVNAQVQFDSTLDGTFEPFHIAGNGIANDGALLYLSGTMTTNGTLFLEADASVGSAAGKLILNQVLVAATFSNFTKVGAGVLQLNQNATLIGTTTISAGTLTVNGNNQFSAVTLAGGTLAGFGTTGPITSTSGTILPGLNQTPVVLRTGDVSMSGATYSPTFSHVAAGDTSDLLQVTGSVNLTGATLSPIIASGFTPTRTFSLLLIENDGTDAIVGTFNGLAEGATVLVAGVPFEITYKGHTGNDVLLVPSVPIPDTDPFAVSGLPNGVAVSYPTATAGVYQTLPSVQFQPFGAINASVRVATADVDGDHIKDVIFVTGPGVPIRVAVISGVDSKVIVAPFDPFGGNFTGGGFVAAADLDADDKAEVIVTPDRGGGPRVVLFSLNGNTLQQRNSFLGIEDNSFRGGARPALGDIDGDLVPELVVSAGFLGGPRIAVFNGASLLGSPTHLVGDFFAFETSLRNGAYVAVGDVNGDSKGDLIFGAGPGGAPRLLTISGAALLNSGAGAAIAAPLSNFFVAGNTEDRGGVRVTTNDTDNDAKADVIVGSGEGSASKVRVYLGKNFGGGEPALFQDLNPFSSGVLTDGTFVG
jgi:autotransporter-associated beta strand protein